jgi:integrase/recombinase XerD
MTSLRQQMIEDMQLRNLSPVTQRAYVEQVARFALHFRKSPNALGPEEIRRHQLHLFREKKLAASSIQVAVAALRFFYKVTLKKDWSVNEVIPSCRKPHKLPVVLSPEEVARFLGCLESGKHRVILMACYAAGLRISEAVRLKAASIDSQRMVIRVEQGKGRKDRYVMLSPKLLDALRNYWDAGRPRDWLFPGDLPGQPIGPLAVDHACRKARQSSGLAKPITPHALRHAFAVHLLKSATDLRTIQIRAAAYRRAWVPALRYAPAGMTRKDAYIA